MRLLHHHPECCARVLDAQLLRGDLQRRLGIIGSQRSDGWIVEESLGIGLGVAGQSGELRQPGAHEDNGQVELAGPVDGGDESAELVRVEVLHLVDGEECSRSRFGDRLADGDEQIGEILRQDARVRGPRQRLDAQGDRRAVRQLVAERPQCTQCPVDRTPSRSGVQLQQQLAQAGRQQCAEIACLRCLDVGHPQALSGGDLGEAVEQHRLAHTPESDGHGALPRSAGEGTPHRHPEAIDELVAPDQRRRTGTGTRPVGVVELVHLNGPYHVLCILVRQT